MSREVHVRFCESLGVKFPRATHPYIWTTEGWLYLAVILDLYSRAIIGWATIERIDAHLVCTAFQRALWQYQPGLPVIYHSDRGSQYTSRMFRKLMAEQTVQFI